MINVQELAKLAAGTLAKELSGGIHQVAQELTYQCFTPLWSRLGHRGQHSYLTFPFPPKLCTVQVLHLVTAWAPVMAIPFSAQGLNGTWRVAASRTRVQAEQGAGSPGEHSLLAVLHPMSRSMAMLAMPLLRCLQIPPQSPVPALQSCEVNTSFQNLYDNIAQDRSH